MTPALDRIYLGSCLETMRSWPDRFVHCAVTSPPYFGLRDYGHAGQIGLEASPSAYIERLVEVFREVRRVLRDDGTLWLNLGDSYASTWACGRRNAIGEGACDVSDRQRRAGNGIKEKDLVGIPWMVAFALRADGWYLRQDIIWSKPNPMPESVTDRCTKSHEYLFLLTKSERYYYDAEAISEPVAWSTIERVSQNVEAQAGAETDPSRREGRMKAVVKKSGNRERKPRPGAPKDSPQNQSGSVPWEGTMRNKRSVWTVSTKPFSEAHFATFPTDLIAPCVIAGAPRGGVVLDPFMGAGTTALVAATQDRRFLGCELNPEYVEMARRRVAAETAQGKML